MGDAAQLPVSHSANLPPVLPLALGANCSHALLPSWATALVPQAGGQRPVKRLWPRHTPRLCFAPGSAKEHRPTSTSTYTFQHSLNSLHGKNATQWSVL